MQNLPKDPTVAAWVALVRASNGVISAIQAEGKAAGMPPLEWYDVLWDLERSPDGARRPFELEKGLLLAQYNLSRLVDRLHRAGLVDKLKCPEDGRGLVLVITEEGRSLRRRMWPVYSAAIEKHIGSHLHTDEARTLAALLMRLLPGGDPAADCGETHPERREPAPAS
jgi:DNA-binding MarR family transcriptional regulator